ncbi:hypothetical protein ABS751_10495 [Bacillus subtilis]|nr:hypothetical protein [Bacillus subtilis]AYK68253.1 hypothetical protein D9C11_23320 [Bacillus subtilis subsp. subtilis]
MTELPNIKLKEIRESDLDASLIQIIEEAASLIGEKDAIKIFLDELVAPACFECEEQTDDEVKRQAYSLNLNDISDALKQVYGKGAAAQLNELYWESDVYGKVE